MGFREPSNKPLQDASPTICPLVESNRRSSTIFAFDGRAIFSCVDTGIQRRSAAHPPWYRPRPSLRCSWRPLLQLRFRLSFTSVATSRICPAPRTLVAHCTGFSGRQNWREVLASPGVFRDLLAILRRVCTSAGRFSGRYAQVSISAMDVNPLGEFSHDSALGSVDPPSKLADDQGIDPLFETPRMK